MHEDSQLVLVDSEDIERVFYEWDVILDSAGRELEVAKALPDVQKVLACPRHEDGSEEAEESTVQLSYHEIVLIPAMRRITAQQSKPAFRRGTLVNIVRAHQYKGYEGRVLETTPAGVRVEVSVIPPYTGLFNIEYLRRSDKE